jgi:hypothetical protein
MKKSELNSLQSVLEAVITSTWKGEWPVASSGDHSTCPFLHSGNANDHNVILKLTYLAII